MTTFLLPLGVQGTLIANGDILRVGLDPNVQTDVIVKIGATAWTGTITFKGAVGDTDTPAAIAAAEMGTPGTFATTATANGTYRINANGMKYVDIVLTNLASGGPVTVAATVSAVTK